MGKMLTMYFHYVFSLLSIYHHDFLYFTEKATLPKLISFKFQYGRPTNIARRIGSNWFTFGILLLDDNEGDIVTAISQQNHGNPERINLDILQTWIRGQGIRDRTWRGLLGALEEGGCNTLAEEMKEVLLPKSMVPGKHLQLVTH